MARRRELRAQIKDQNNAVPPVPDAEKFHQRDAAVRPDNARSGRSIYDLCGEMLERRPRH